ncbi:hypothetical protein A3A39_02295 [Candidatus Kaiserbacteria bacterium RIFCSPLOWO2_01_FULL_54_13]|uniref:Uncharacterized protein n=1 Tax=Candidatus Kaiserbacteria bacterium RIFCSPLOWO2_01_FULL_54_13 TaxID=1798512 RepID=A0A1F6F193_9BACT|nr:MAG: hypothetical protein A3A39_02295 [Candidatus Kaiserbacteria bacterium RIFCSPLOWO2_01_FULL_54_13]
MTTSAQRFFTGLLLLVLGIAVFVRGVGPGTDIFRSCLELDSGPRFECFQELVNETARTGNYAEAFTIVAHAYELDPDFAANCHASAHEIGKIAYDRFRRGEASIFTSRASACGYGFYHSFMEKLFADGRAAEEAQDFCGYLGEELSLETVDARGACYHGIGHGTVDGTDPRLWGDPRALVREGIGMCEAVAGSLPDIPEGYGPLFRCVSGTYNALEILSQNEKYNLEVLAEDPFGFCNDERHTYRRACYTNMIPALLRLRLEDFRSVLSEIENIQDITDVVRARLVGDLFHEFIRLHLGDGRDAGASAIPLCKGMRDTLRIGCIEGLSGGYLKYGAPKHEAEGMLHFCALAELSEEESLACFRYGLTRLRNHYSPDEARAVCLRAPEEFRRFCERESAHKSAP